MQPVAVSAYSGAFGWYGVLELVKSNYFVIVPSELLSFQTELTMISTGELDLGFVPGDTPQFFNR